MIDYWDVDWDNKSDTFHNQWQSYRTRKDPKIELEGRHTYPEAGRYTVVVKVIDILGNDTTKTVEVTVKYGRQE
ncbi:MAG: PKD domain-containing protein [Terriglobia bacterium]